MASAERVRKFNQEVLDEFPARLQRLSGLRGWSARETGKRAQLDGDTVAKLFRGARHPNLESVVKLADAYEVTVTDLLEGTGQ